MKYRILTILAAVLGLIAPTRAMQYAGADISMLPLYEQIGARYNDYDGNPLPDNDVIRWYAAQGMNTMRVRLFVDPSKQLESNYKYDNGNIVVDRQDGLSGKPDQNVCQTKEYILPICRRIKQAGMKLILDFHYSDYWADPTKQWIPVEWRGLSDDQLYQKIYDYTKETLQWFKDRGVVPDMIQTGNEISWGMLWGTPNSGTLHRTANWEWDSEWNRLTTLLKRAGEACREICPLAKIILHTEQVTNESNLWNFYRHIGDAGVNYDIIGLSWYPYWHGDMDTLEYVLGKIEENFPGKQVMLMEFNHPYNWREGGSDDFYNKYPPTYEGQQKCTQATIDVLNRHPAANGLIWWWAEFNKNQYNHYEGEGWDGWYSSPLFDSNNGNATPATRLVADYAKADPGYSIYFVNLPASWSAAGLYAFNNDNGQFFQETDWPGNALVPTDRTYKGKQVWKYTLSDENYKRLVVNNRHDDGNGNYVSTDQTFDFDYAPNAIYELSDWRSYDSNSQMWKYELSKQDGATLDAPYVYLVVPDSWTNPVVSAWTNDGDNECDAASLEDSGLTWQGRKVWKKTFTGDKHNTLLFYDYPWENGRIAENRQFVNGALYIISDEKNCQWNERYTAAYILDPGFDGTGMPDNIDLYGHVNGIEDWSDSAMAFRARRTGSGRYYFDLEVTKESWFRLRINGTPYGPESQDYDRDLATVDNEVRVRENYNKAFHITTAGSYTITVEWREGDNNQYMLSVGPRRQPVAWPDLYIIGDQNEKNWKASADWRLNPDGNGKYTITRGDSYPASWFKVSTADWTETYSTGKSVLPNHTYLCGENYDGNANMHVDSDIAGSNSDGSKAIAIFDCIENTFRIEAWTADKFTDRDHKRIYIHFGHNRQQFGTDATPRVHLFDRNRTTTPSDEELDGYNSFDLVRADSSDPTYDLWYYELTDDQMNWAEDATFFYTNKDTAGGKYAKYTCGIYFNGQDFNWDFRNWHKYIYYVDVADNYNGKATQSYITWDQLRPLRVADENGIYPGKQELCVVGCGFKAIDQGQEGRNGWDRIVDRTVFRADATMNVFYVENMQKGSTVPSTTLGGTGYNGAKFKMSWIWPWKWWNECRSTGTEKDDIFDQRAWATFNLGIIGYDLTRAAAAALSPELAKNKTNYEVYFESAKTFPCNNFNQYDWFVPESLLNGTYTLVVDLDAGCNSATLLPFAPNPMAKTGNVDIQPASLDSYADIDRLWPDDTYTVLAAAKNGPVKYRKYNVATAELGVDSPSDYSTITNAQYSVDYNIYYNGEQRATYSGVPGSVSVTGFPVGENDYVGIRAKYTDGRTLFTFHSKYSQDKVSVTAQTPAPQIGNASSIQYANRVEHDGWFTLGAYFKVPVSTPTSLNWYADYEVTPEDYTDDNVISKGGELVHAAHAINLNGQYGWLNGWDYYTGGTFGDSHDWSHKLSQSGVEWPIYLDVVKSIEHKDTYTDADGRASLRMDAHAIYPFLVDLNPVPVATGSRQAQAARKAPGITDGHSYRLTFVRSSSSAPVTLSDVITGLDAIDADSAAGPVTWYNLQGVEVQGDLAPGIYIRRQGNTAVKTVVR